MDSTLGTRHLAEPVSEVSCLLGESPLWDPAGTLYWLDVDGRILHKLHSGTTPTSVSLERRVTAIELGPADELVAAAGDSVAWCDPVSGKLRDWPCGLATDAGTNDAAVAPDGSFWLGTVYPDRRPEGSLFSVTPTSAAACVLGGLRLSNGMDWSPDGRVLYHADSVTGHIWKWDYDRRDGHLAGGEVLARIPGSTGMPDGLCVDLQGQVWVALWGAGQVWCLDGDSGAVCATVDLPTTLATSCEFGGDDLETLYITTAWRSGDRRSGLLYAVEPGAQGQRPRHVAEPAA
ncbi:SMP-30/gluconolactonase/LRE family protein [Amycolatopsis thermoflava]|uniref:SMP-30/gluconolactonase/LRE family protein n=1 Tax=Amycolatopsis thermoflava TaxID=84480 RepID=UPI003F49CA66